MRWIRVPAKLTGGCPIDSASREYDHQPGAMRDAVMERQRLLDRELSKAAQLAVDAGELAVRTDTRPRSRSHAAGNAMPAWHTVHNVNAQSRSEVLHPLVLPSTGRIEPNPYCWTPAASIAAQLLHSIQRRECPSRSRSVSPTR